MGPNKPNIARDTSLKNYIKVINIREDNPFGGSGIAFNHVSLEDIKLIVQAAVSHCTGCLTIPLLKNCTLEKHRAVTLTVIKSYYY